MSITDEQARAAAEREHRRRKAREVGQRVANALGLESYIEMIDGKEHRYYYTPGNGKNTSVGALCLGLAVESIITDVEREVR